MTHFLSHLDPFCLMIIFFFANFVKLLVIELVFFKYYNLLPYFHPNFNHLLITVIILDYYYLLRSFLFISFFYNNL
jgi:hypothetical protein